MIIIICGMHRSGTSALAGLLHSNGIIMGEEKNFIPKPKKQNSKGFFENYRFRLFNDELLAYNNYKAKSFNPIIPQIIPSIKSYEVAQKLINEYNNKYNIWGFKDPRTCLTLNFWLLAMGSIDKKIIVNYRNFDSISKSLWSRKNRGDIKKFIKLCEVYYSRVEKVLKNFSHVPIINLDFDNLCNNTEKEAERLFKFLEHDIKDLSFIENKLRHHVGEN